MSKPRPVTKKTQFSQVLTVLNKIGQTLVVIQDPSEVLEQIAENAKEVLGADIIDLYEYVQARNDFILPPILVGKRWDSTVKFETYDDDVAVKVVKAGKPKYFPDAQHVELLTKEYDVSRVDAPKQRFVIREGVISSASIPLLAGNETVGVMFINYRTQQVFDDEQKIIIESFSNLAAIAIYNARLYKADQNQAQALARLSQLSQRLVLIAEEHKDVRKLLEEIAESAKEVLKADILDLYEYSQTKKAYELPQISAGKGRGPFVPKKTIYEDDVVLDLIYRDQSSYIEDAQADPIMTKDYTIKRTDQPAERYVVREKIMSTAAIPLKSGNETVGIMFANYRTKREFTKEQKELIELFANQAAIAIQNARLYHRLESQVEERTKQLEDTNRRLETLIAFGRTLTSGIRLEIGEILNLIHKQASALMDTNNMYVALYDEEKDEVLFGLAFENGHQIDVKTEPNWQPRKAGQGKTEEIIRVCFI